MENTTLCGDMLHCVLEYNFFLIKHNGFNSIFCSKTQQFMVELMYNILYFVAAHSKKYHKYITNIPQIYHKNTTKCDIVPQKGEFFVTKCNILPHSVVFFINNPTTNFTILLQNLIFYHKLVYYTINGSVSTTEKVFYHIV